MRGSPGQSVAGVQRVQLVRSNPSRPEFVAVASADRASLELMSDHSTGQELISWAARAAGRSDARPHHRELRPRRV